MHIEILEIPSLPIGVMREKRECRISILADNQNRVYKALSKCI